MNFKESQKKFRAYDTKNEKFAFVGFHIIGEVTLLGALEIYKHENSLSLDETLELKITQFTGLLDSKGVEIYEGDIVQTTGFVFNDKEKTKKSEIDFISLIEFCPKKSCFVTVSPKYGGVHGLLFMDILEMHDKQIKVIGNIYETPQLLE